MSWCIDRIDQRRKTMRKTCAPASESLAVAGVTGAKDCEPVTSVPCVRSVGSGTGWGMGWGLNSTLMIAEIWRNHRKSMEIHNNIQ